MKQFWIGLLLIAFIAAHWMSGKSLTNLYAADEKGLLPSRISHFRIEGEIDFLNDSFNIKSFPDQEGRHFFINGKKLSDQEYQLEFDLNHVELSRLDLSVHIQNVMQFPAGEKTTTFSSKGKLSSQYALLNGLPIRDLSGKYEVKDGTLFLDNISFGQFTARGFVKLEHPYESQLAIDVRSLGLDDFLSAWLTDKKYAYAGLIKGALNLSGNLKAVFLKGNFFAEDVIYRDKMLDQLTVNFSGYYPHIQISDTLGTQHDGLSFRAEGPFNLKDQQSYPRQIASLKARPLVSESSTEKEWTFKRLENPDFGTTELKYLLLKDETPGNNVGDEQRGIFGIERVLEF